MKMKESSPNGLKTLWEKEKLLVTRNFSFSHSVFKRCVQQTRKNEGLFGKGLDKIGPVVAEIQHGQEKKLQSDKQTDGPISSLLYTPQKYFCGSTV